MHQIVGPSFERSDERGAFVEILNSGRWESAIMGRMRASAVMGQHYHRQATLFFYLANGQARISTVHVETAAKDQFVLSAKQGVFLPPMESHAIRFLEESDFVLLKTKAYDPANSDIVPFPVEGS